jgi:hypothetical protein
VSIVLTGSGGFFPRQGAIIGEFNRVAALYGSAATDPAFESIWSQFATSDQAAVTPLPAGVVAFRQTDQTYCSVLTQVGQQAIILQADRDSPLNPNTFATAFNRVATQMADTAQTIQRPTLTTAVSYAGDNIGDVKFFVSTTNIYGDPLDTTQTETFTATCTSQGTGASLANSFSVVGQPAVTTNSWNWPQGTGASTSVSAVNAATDGTITNGGFSEWTVPNTPDDWTIINGSAGTTVVQAVGGGVRSGTDAVRFVSDGASATQIAQEVSLVVNTVYAVTFQAKMNVNSASGTLVVQLYDPDLGAVIADDAGTNLSATYALNGGAGEITTSYQLLTVFFSTPRQLPTNVQLRIGYGVAGVSTRQLNVDLVQVFAPTPLYGLQGSGTSGPFVCAVANTAVDAVGDRATIAFTNSLTTQSFVLGLQRVYDTRSQGLYLPSALSPTLPDNLVSH